MVGVFPKETSKSTQPKNKVALKMERIGGEDIGQRTSINQVALMEA
jgi:hypothetical protein